MKRSEKEQLVADLRGKIAGAQALYFTDFTGMSVKRMTALRRRLRTAGVEYVVIKNTLALRAVNESGLAGERLRGPTGIIVARDALAGAKAITDFAKENDQKPAVKGGLFDGQVINAGFWSFSKAITDFAKENDQKPAVKGGLFDGQVINAEQVTALANMPSREQMLAELGAGLMSPLASFAGTLGGLLSMMVGALEALRAQKDGGDAAA